MVSNLFYKIYTFRHQSSFFTRTFFKSRNVFLSTVLISTSLICCSSSRFTIAIFYTSLTQSIAKCWKFILTWLFSLHSKLNLQCLCYLLHYGFIYLSILSFKIQSQLKTVTCSHKAVLSSVSPLFSLLTTFTCVGKFLFTLVVSGTPVKTVECLLFISFEIHYNRSVTTLNTAARLSPSEQKITSPLLISILTFLLFRYILFCFRLCRSSDYSLIVIIKNHCL